MSTFREFAAKVIEQTRDELQADGLIDDKAGVLAGAMVDAATIAVQEWFRSELFQNQFVTLTRWDVDSSFGPEEALNELIREAGRVTP